MTSPATDTLEREKDKLYVTDAELIRRMGVPDKVARDAIAVLDRDRASQFPPKLALFGNRRYWPAVRAYFDRAHGLNMDAPQRRERPWLRDRA